MTSRCLGFTSGEYMSLNMASWQCLQCRCQILDKLCGFSGDNCINRPECSDSHKLTGEFSGDEGCELSPKIQGERGDF